MATIAVCSIPNKGKGYIAQRDIKVGEILLEETALQTIAPHKAFEELATKLLAIPELSDALQFDQSQGGDKISKAIAQVRLNSFLSRVSTENDVYTLLIDPKGSFYNHSCFPNAATHMRESGISITFALVPIAAGEEICYKTKALFLPTARRQKLLQDNWGFACTCARCVTPLPNDTLLMQGNMTANEAKKMTEEFDSLEQLKDQVDSYEDAERWVKRAEEFLHVDLHNAHWRKIVIRQGLIHFLLNPHFARKPVLKYVRQQIEVYNLLAPALHNCKLELFMTYRQVAGTNDWREQLQKLDSNADTVLLWYFVDGQTTEGNK